MSPEEMEIYIKAQNAHQLQCDIRIANQRREIARLVEELSQSRKSERNATRWATETEQWKDRDSAFWKISHLKVQNELLHARLYMASRLLKGGVGYEALRSTIAEVKRDAD